MCLYFRTLLFILKYQLFNRFPPDRNLLFFCSSYFSERGYIMCRKIVTFLNAILTDNHLTRITVPYSHFTFVLRATFFNLFLDYFQLSLNLKISPELWTRRFHRNLFHIPWTRNSNRKLNRPSTFWAWECKYSCNLWILWRVLFGLSCCCTFYHTL